MLPVELPEITDFEPEIVPDDAESVPEPPLARAGQWATVTLDLGEGPRQYRRELNTMPQWAGSCWYYLRYLDPTNDEQLVSPEADGYWMPPDGVDLYVGGVEHAVLHLLYARFWHKVLFDLGYVSTPEPFQRLYNQGTIQAFVFRDERGVSVEASEVEERDGGYFHDGEPVIRQLGKMGKSLRNAVSPDDIYRDYGADTLRLYEMFTGPLDVSRPWNTADIVGVHRFLQRVWRNVIDEATGEPHVTAEPADTETRRLLHRTIDAVANDMARMSFNTAIARLFELNNQLTKVVEETGEAPEEVVQPLILMLAPLAPHLAEELWERLGNEDSLAYVEFPTADPQWLAVETVEIAVQLNGKVRARLTVDAGLDENGTEAAARGDAHVAELLDGATVRKVVVVPGRLVNFVLG
jgi:leucyl-tRNA synthetase